MIDPSLRAFLFGVAGSVATEVVSAHIAYRKRGRAPACYSRVGFWVIRGLLALTAGGLALAYGASSDLLAMHVGVSAPLIVDNFARIAPDSGEHEK